MSALKGSGALYYVAGSDNHICAMSLIEAGIDVNQRNFEGNPPLEHAVRKGQLEMVKILLKAGAIYDNSYFTNSIGPLHIAAKCCWPEIVQLLIKVGADVNARDSRLKTPLHLVNEYRSGENADDHCKIIDLLFSAGANINAQDIDGFTPIEDSVCHKFCAGFDLLLSLGVEFRDEERRLRCFVIALTTDNLYVIKRLMDLQSNELDGNTCLRLAASFSRNVIVEHLLKNGAQVNVLNTQGFDPLCEGLEVWCFSSRRRADNLNNDQDKALAEHELFMHRIRCLELLIEYGANVNNVTKKGLTPLYMVLQDFGHPSGFLWILLKNGAKFDFEHPIVDKVMNDKDGSKFAHLLLKHTALYVAQGRTDVPANFDAAKLNEELQEDYRHCRDELDLMKTTKFDDYDVSCFHLLVNKEIGPFARNEHIVREFEALDVPKRFPIYSDLLTERFYKEVKVQKVVRVATTALGHVLRWDEKSMRVVLDKIVSYLGKEDLSNLALIINEKEAI